MCRPGSNLRFFSYPLRSLRYCRPALFTLRVMIGSSNLLPSPSRTHTHLDPAAMESLGGCSARPLIVLLPGQVEPAPERESGTLAAVSRCGPRTLVGGRRTFRPILLGCLLSLDRLVAHGMLGAACRTVPAACSTMLTRINDWLDAA